MKKTKEKTSEKSKLNTALFCIFFGTLGIHNFYAGNKGKGIAQLLLTLSIIGLFISWIWCIVEFFMILTDNFKDGKGLIIK